MSQYKFKINGKDYEVRIDGIEDGIAKVNVNGVDYDVELEAAAAQSVARSSEASQPSAPAPNPAEESSPATAAGGTRAGAGCKVVSPLPGVIIEVCVGPGEVVKKGQRIAVIEAMKMENDILAEATGRIAEVFVKKGDSVLEGADIASIA